MSGHNRSPKQSNLPKWATRFRWLLLSIAIVLLGFAVGLPVLGFVAAFLVLFWRLLNRILLVLSPKTWLSDRVVNLLQKGLDTRRDTKDRIAAEANAKLESKRASLQPGTNERELVQEIRQEAADLYRAEKKTHRRSSRRKFASGVGKGAGVAGKGAYKIVRGTGKIAYRTARPGKHRPRWTDSIGADSESSG